MMMNFSRTPLWPDYRTIWRWHFFAGLFCLPFIILLCLTGSIYLFKPQVDHWIDWRYDHLTGGATHSTPEQEVRAALHAVSGSHFLAYELPETTSSAARVIVDRQGTAIRVYVDPTSCVVLKQVPEENRFERIIFKLHGQLLLGNTGSIIMEMVASWTIVLIATGLYLWWPRHTQGQRGILYPRITHKGRIRWRDLHAVTGMWISLFLVLFLISGLPWSFIWGHALSSVETQISRMTTVPDWEIGAVSERNLVAGHQVSSPKMDTMPGMDMGSMTMSDSALADGLNRVVLTASQLKFPAPVLVTPPSTGEATWHIRSDTQNRPERISALLEASGQVRSVQRFEDKTLMDRIIGYGVATHEGQLFGRANQLLNFLVASGLLTMSVSALILWLRRRPPGQLGAPLAVPDKQIGAGALAILVLLGVLLPELGASLLLLWLANLLLQTFRHS
ncbi:PepSY-associated TM helix domain-containing protein [Gluconobacter sphaericus]|uniref:PepSY-associated TM helix domain-containing protein n=1 Tax=Gluconobacter sphaericus TaxID=574987 RepID=UPI001141C508|nr:PepSY domain-containing protein [Gluconobacter sphaericus]MBF0886551.1 PepSY domain-containing protein [Gluconobacter sphaericus]